VGGSGTGTDEAQLRRFGKGEHIELRKRSKGPRCSRKVTHVGRSNHLLDQDVGKGGGRHKREKEKNKCYRPVERSLGNTREEAETAPPVSTERDCVRGVGDERRENSKISQNHGLWGKCFLVARGFLPKGTEFKWRIQEKKQGAESDGSGMARTGKEAEVETKTP